MNGCDHQPVQTNLSEALRKAKELFPDVEFVHSNFIDYIRSVQTQLPERLAVVSGELRSQRTDGWNTLVNTASARVYIKQENQRCQTLLEKAAEPLAALAVQAGTPYPHHFLTYAWKTLMQNHPHDSICGCSVDEVHREMMTRFAKSRQVAESVISDSLRIIAGSIDTSRFASDDREAVPFAVFNTTGWARKGLVSIELDIQKVRFDGMNASDAYRSLAARQIGKGKLTDARGNGIPFQMEDLGVNFHYELPDDAFRQRYWVRRIKVTFEAADIPALGYATYVWSSQEPERLPEPTGSLKVSEREMENDWLKVAIAGNGSLILTDKTSGRTYTDVLVYEDSGDIGNEYMFKQPDDEVPLTTAGLSAKINLVERSPVHAIFEVVHEWELPARANDEHYEDIRQMVNFRRGRSGQRVGEKVPFVITTRIALERSSKNVKITVSFDNQAKDHRLRVLIPTDLQAEYHTADSIFEAVRRSNSPSPEWTNPSYCHHQQAFVDITGDGAGITVANRGLNEYEILRDGRNTIAITLLRAVAELGDWGVFPTPEAECLGTHTMEFTLIPHAGNGIESGSFVQAYQYQVPWFFRQTEVHHGSLPAAYSMLSWSGPSLALSGVKRNEETGDLIVRWFNLSHRHEQLSMMLPDHSHSVYSGNVLEERVASLPHEAGEVTLDVSPCQIITLSFAEE